MLDINLVRDNPELIKKTLEKRNQHDKIKWLHDLINLDKEYRSDLKKIENLRHERNIISEKINSLKKENKNASAEIKRARELPDEISNLEKKNDERKNKIDYYLFNLPNILHEKVPYGKTAEDNPIIRKVGKIPKFKFELLNHEEIAEKLGIADFDQGREVSGQGFNYLKKELAILDLALQRYGIDFLLKKGFNLVMPPMMLKREALAGAIDSNVFQDVYKIDNEDLYLIGTAEHSLVNLFKNKTLNKEDLPVKVCAITSCFRKEIGGHGVDTKGLFRMHQFNKVEQVVFTTKENSYKFLDEMEKITEDFFKSLKIPFRVIEICSGDLGGKFSKQYDIEAYFPRQKTYKEVTSAGNCVDYQARRLNIKYKDKEEKYYVHILNNTMVATSRAMVAILENYQQKNHDIKIPNVLQKYTGFKVIKCQKK